MGKEVVGFVGLGNMGIGALPADARLILFINQLAKTANTVWLLVQAWRATCSAS